jgi:hypothetical protein
MSLVKWASLRLSEIAMSGLMIASAACLVDMACSTSAVDIAEAERAADRPVSLKHRDMVPGTEKSRVGDIAPGESPPHSITNPMRSE